MTTGTPALTTGNEMEKNLTSDAILFKINVLMEDIKTDEEIPIETKNKILTSQITNYHTQLSMQVSELNDTETYFEEQRYERKHQEVSTHLHYPHQHHGEDEEEEEDENDETYDEEAEEEQEDDEEEEEKRLFRKSLQLRKNLKDFYLDLTSRYHRWKGEYLQKMHKKREDELHHQHFLHEKDKRHKEEERLTATRFWKKRIFQGVLLGLGLSVLLVRWNRKYLSCSSDDEVEVQLLVLK